MSTPNPLLDGRTGAPPVSVLSGVSAADIERVLAPLISAWERVLTAQGAQFQAMSGRIDQMARSLDEDRRQNVEVLQQAQATMEVATHLIEQTDENLDKLVETTLALQAIYDVEQEAAEEAEQ